MAELVTSVSLIEVCARAPTTMDATSLHKCENK